jgi:hypothetical protein
MKKWQEWPGDKVTGEKKKAVLGKGRPFGI